MPLPTPMGRKILAAASKGDGPYSRCHVDECRSNTHFHKLRFDPYYGAKRRNAEKVRRPPKPGIFIQCTSSLDPQSSDHCEMAFDHFHNLLGAAVRDGIVWAPTIAALDENERERLQRKCREWEVANEDRYQAHLAAKRAAEKSPEPLQVSEHVGDDHDLDEKHGYVRFADPLVTDPPRPKEAAPLRNPHPDCKDHRIVVDLPVVWEAPLLEPVVTPTVEPPSVEDNFTLWQYITDEPPDFSEHSRGYEALDILRPDVYSDVQSTATDHTVTIYDIGQRPCYHATTVKHYNSRELTVPDDENCLISQSNITSWSPPSFKRMLLAGCATLLNNFGANSNRLIDYAVTNPTTSASIVASNVAHNPILAAAVIPPMCHASAQIAHFATTTALAAASGPLVPALAGAAATAAIIDANTKRSLPARDRLDRPRDNSPIVGATLPHCRHANYLSREKRTLLIRASHKRPRGFWRRAVNAALEYVPGVTSIRQQIYDCNEFDPTIAVVNAQMRGFVAGWTQYTRERSMPFYTHRGKQYLLLGPNEFDNATEVLIYPHLFDELNSAESMLGTTRVIDSDMLPLQSFNSAVRNVAGRLKRRDEWVKCDDDAYHSTLRFFYQYSLFNAVLDALAAVGPREHVDFQVRVPLQLGHTSEPLSELAPRRQPSMKPTCITVTSKSSKVTSGSTTVN